MRDRRFSLRVDRGALAVLVVFFTVFYALQNLNGRFWMHDFEVYWRAARAFWSGGEVYGAPFGLSTGFYKYSPFFLMALGPVAALPFFAARTFHFFLTAAGAVIALHGFSALARGVLLGEDPSRPARAVILLGFLVTAVHLYRELHLGNVNLLLLVLLGGTAVLLLENRDRAAGLLLGIVCLVKPPFLVLAGWLALRRRGKALAGTAVALGAGVLVPALRVGVGRNLELHREWGRTMTTHGAELWDGPNTLYAWGYRVAGGVPDSPGAWVVPLVFGIAGLLFLALIVLHARTRPDRAAAADIDLFLEFFLLVAAVPLVTLTDTEHFLLSLPLILAVFLLLRRPGTHPGLVAAAVVLLVGYGGNWHDLVGHRISTAWDGSGLLGLSHLGLMLLAVLLIHRVRRERWAVEAA